MGVLISIVLLNYNGKIFNRNCIDSILNQSYKHFEIIFVDQCSTDGSLEEVENLYKNEIENGKIKIVKNTENNGFTGGNNLGVKYADKDSKYICLLNNDTIVPKNWLEELLKGIESDEQLGAVSCLILDKGYETKLKNQIFKNRKKCVSTILGESVFVDMNEKEIKSNFYYTTFLCGCCFLYNRDIIDEPFPQYYFAYAEDLFLSWLIINKGYKLGVCLDTYVNHYGSGSFGSKPSPFKLFHGNKNQMINYLVFYPIFYRILLFPLFIIKEIAHLFMGAPLMRLKAKIKGWFRILGNYGNVKASRLYIKENKTISSFSFYKQLSYKLSDSYYVNKNILKLFINMGNILFITYCNITKLLTAIVNGMSVIIKWNPRKQ